MDFEINATREVFPVVQFGNLLPEDNLAVKALNGLDLMAEYDARTVNIGAHYQLWKDHINLIAELNNGKYFSGGIYFKIHLK
jgi:hypothetical protein